MRVPFLDIQAQYRELASELDSVVHEVISSGAYVLGPHNKGLEQEVAEMHGVRHAIAVNSGTDALRIAMQASDVQCGDEVITTGFTFVASIEAIVQLGATPVLVDVDAATQQIDPEKIEAAITPKTKAILPIHLFGQLCDMAAIREIADRHGLMVLEDAAQAIDSHCNGVYAGNYGKAAGISFYVTKNLGAAGDGGMILTNDDDVAARSRSLRVHGMGRERYYYDEVGYTSRMAELQAAILRVKLTRLKAWGLRRAELAQIYDRELAGTGIQIPVTLPGNNHTYHQYTVRAERRDALQAYLKEREIDSMIYYPVPLHFHEPYRSLGEKGSLPVTEKVSLEVLSLPIHHYLTEDQVQHVARTIQEFCATGAAR